jgi:hypothetical protein
MRLLGVRELLLLLLLGGEERLLVVDMFGGMEEGGGYVYVCFCWEGEGGLLLNVGVVEGRVLENELCGLGSVLCRVICWRCSIVERTCRG